MGSDPTVYPDLPTANVPTDALFRCGSTWFEVEKVQYQGDRTIVCLVARGDPDAPVMSSGLVTYDTPAADRVVDLMAALEDSIVEAKAARDRQKNGRGSDV